MGWRFTPGRSAASWQPGPLEPPVAVLKPQSTAPGLLGQLPSLPSQTTAAERQTLQKVLVPLLFSLCLLSQHTTAIKGQGQGQQGMVTMRLWLQGVGSWSKGAIWCLCVFHVGEQRDEQGDGRETFQETKQVRLGLLAA